MAPGAEQLHEARAAGAGLATVDARTLRDGNTERPRLFDGVLEFLEHRDQVRVPWN